MEILQLNCFFEKCIAIGFDSGEVQLFRVPSFEVVHTIRIPSDRTVGRIRHLRGDPKLLSVRSGDFASGLYLRNGNVLLVSQKASYMPHNIEEHQVVR